MDTILANMKTDAVKQAALYNYSKNAKGNYS